MAEAGATATAAWQRSIRLADDTKGAIAPPGEPTSTPPPVLTEALGRLPVLARDGAEGNAELRARWAARRSGLGFYPLPPPADISVPPERLSNATVGPLIAQPEGDDLLVSANGYVDRFAHARWSTLGRLASGETLDRTEVDPELALALARWRALASDKVGRP